MKAVYMFLVFIFLAGSIFADNFGKIKQDMAKDAVIKLVGNPTKKLASSDKQSEYYVWIVKNDVWCVMFNKGKTTGEAAKIEDILTGWLEVSSSFSSLGDYFTESTNAPDISTSNEKTAKKPNANLVSQIEVTVLDASIVDTLLYGNRAGFRLKIKNNSTVSIYSLHVTVYYLDKNGKRFYEETYHPVSSSSWTDKIVLKPNYSMVYPSDNTYMTADKLDLSEWDEGKVEVEVTEIGTEKPEE